MSSVIFVAQIVCVAIGWMLAHSTGGQARHCPLKDLGARLRIEGSAKVILEFPARNKEDHVVLICHADRSSCER